MYTVETAFNSENVRWDTVTRAFILVVADHPVFINQASREFVEKNPHRFLTAKQLAACLDGAANLAAELDQARS